MRLLPWFVVVLVLSVGGYLGFQVLLQRTAPAPVPVAGSESPVPQGHVYAGISDKPDTLNPFLTHLSAVRRYVLGFTHESLLDFDPDSLEPRGVLAQSWQLQPGGTEITMVLRPGVRFADGKPCTPSDVLFTWEVCKAQPALLGSMADGMSLLRDVRLLPGEPPTLSLQLKLPHFTGVRAIGESWFVVEREFFEQAIAAKARSKGLPVPTSASDPQFGTLLAMIKDSGPGTGPYMLAADADGASIWHDGSELRLVRNPLSWRKAMHLDRWNFAGVHLYFPPDPSAPWLQFCNHEYDWFYDVDLAKQAPQLLPDFRRLVYDNPQYGPVMMHWNLRRLSDPKVRRALGMMFDRDGIARDYYQGAALPAASLFWPDSGCCPADLKPLPFDMPEARRLLREAGYDADAGHPLQLHVVTTTGAGAETMRKIAQDFTKNAYDCGVVVTTQALDLGAIAAMQQQGDWDGYLMRRDFPSYVDPFELFDANGGSNVMGLADAAADALLERARVERGEAARQQLFQAWSRRIDELQPAAFLVFQRSAFLFNSHLQNAVPGGLGMPVEKMWMPAQFQRR